MLADSSTKPRREFRRKFGTRTSVKLNALTPIVPTPEEVEVAYIRDPGALDVEDPTHGLWQGRMISPDILSPETLRYAASRSQVFGTILRMISRDVSQFARRPMFDGDVGFSVVPKIRTHQMSSHEKNEARRIEEFLLKTGRVYNPRRTDTMRDYLIKQAYNTFVYDRMPTQVVWDDNAPLEFKALDGSSVIKTDPAVYLPQTDRGKAVAPISYIQLYKDQIWAEFNASELIFGIRNPNPNLEQNGYGTPELMELIEPITIEIMILTYIDRLLSQGSIPSGMLIIKNANSGQQQLETMSMSSGQANDDFARIIKNQVQGAQNAGRLAVLKLRGNQEAELVVTDRDLDKMPFIQTYEIVQNQIAQKLGFDPAQVGIVQGSIKNSFTDADAKPSRARQSRFRSVASVLGAIADTQINPLINFINPEFCVMWHGIDTQLEQERLSLDKQRMDMGLLTLNQALTHQNLPTYNATEYPWADIPLHPLIFQWEAAKHGIQIGGKKGSSGMGGMNDNARNEMLNDGGDDD